MSALREKKLADFTVKTLKNVRNEHDFSLLYKQIKVSAKEIEAISPSALPRKQRQPNYSILCYVTGNTAAAAVVDYPENLCENYKPIYYKTLNSIVNAIKDRFDQPTFKLFTKAEHLLFKVVGKRYVTDKLKILETYFRGE